MLIPDLIKSAVKNFSKNVLASHIINWSHNNENYAKLQKFLDSKFTIKQKNFALPPSIQPIIAKTFNIPQADIPTTVSVSLPTFCSTFSNTVLANYDFTYPVFSTVQVCILISTQIITSTQEQTSTLNNTSVLWFEIKT